MNDDEVAPSTRVAKPIRPHPSRYESKLEDVVTFWKGEAAWWKRAAFVGWGAVLVGLLAQLVLRG